MIFLTGVLFITDNGDGFLHAKLSENDLVRVYVPISIIRRYKLQPGDNVAGEIRPPKGKEIFSSIFKIRSVNGCNV